MVWDLSNLFIYLLVLPYYNTQYYNKNKNNIHDYRQQREPITAGFVWVYVNLCNN